MHPANTWQPSSLYSSLLASLSRVHAPRVVQLATITAKRTQFSLVERLRSSLRSLRISVISALNTSRD